MVMYLLKFSACLAIFMVFYKLFLEQEKIHLLKRYYLLAAISIALIIPLITFTTYVEPLISSSTDISLIEESSIQSKVIYETANYLPIILWSIYGLGVLLFSLKFVFNLSQIMAKIKRNTKHRAKHITHVLLNDLITPHTFLNYIFLNKQKFETQQIPYEVFIHEEAHAKQKHSLDVLFIELLQIIFWFNPLIYLTKASIRMNHEFLADEAVLKQGIETASYQQILLTFSSNVTEPKLANAINYSSIKKRFTIMKTHTSKQKIWLRSLLLLPLVALTLYGFSGKKVVEKESTTANHIDISNSKDNPILEISFNPDIFKLNGMDTSLSELKKDFIEATDNEKSDLDIKTIGGIKMSLITKIMNELEGNLLKINLDGRAYIIGDDLTSEEQQKATPEEVEEYNKLAKHCNSQLENKQPIIKVKDIERIKYLYNKMSENQKKNAEHFPDFSKVPPPPPPAPKAPKEPKMSKENDVPPPPPIPANVSPEQKKKMKAAIDDYDNNVPPPPAPLAPLDYVIEMAKKGATFYYEGKSISSDEAIKLLKNNDELNIQNKESNSKKPKVYISKDPFVIKE